MPFGCSTATDGVVSMGAPPPPHAIDGRCVSVDSETSTTIMEQPRAAIQQKRERGGLCIKCGTQLFQVKTKTKGLFKASSVEIKVPLSIPGQVERGQCLQCGGRDTPDAAQTAVRRTGPTFTIDDEDVHVEDVQNNGGSFSSGLVTGTGRAVYEGPFNLYGERDGNGTMKWENGDVYKGGFFNGNRHGQGTLSFSDGSEYVGEWECNLQHGIGTRRWANGDCYTGQYQNGKRSGEGRFYFTNGDMYTGNFNCGVMEGFGRYYYASGQRFEGTFSQGRRRGKGKLQRTDGSLDVGVYNNDIRTGPGVRWSADRTQAWKMLDGLVKKKISIAEAVALDYDVEAAALAIETPESTVV